MSLGDKFDKLFNKMKLEFEKQTIELTYSITNNLSRKIDEKLKPIFEENKALKEKIEKLESRIEYLERDSKRNNVIIFGYEEKEETPLGLLEQMREKINRDLNINIEKSEINKVYRIGKVKRRMTKPRPVVVAFTNAWMRDEVLRNKKKFKNIFISEDFPKEVVEKRKLWQSEMKEERKKGNIAYLVYDKLLVKPGNIKKEEENNDLAGTNSTEAREEKPFRRARAKINLPIKYTK